MLCGSHHWTIASLGTGAASLAALLLSVATDHWLYMTERCTHDIFDPETNISYVFNVTMESRVGLWKLCSWNSEFAESTPECIDIGILEGKPEERVDSQWQTGAVTEATRIQFPLTCLSVFLTLSGFIYSIVGNYKKDRKTIIAAVMYILSGLCLAVGVILYISSINDELAHQQKSNCSFFSYRYGWSFFLIGVSFVMEETSAVISIKLFLARNFVRLDDMVRIIPGLEDKIYLKSGTALETSSQTLIW